MSRTRSLWNEARRAALLLFVILFAGGAPGCAGDGGTGAPGGGSEVATAAQHASASAWNPAAPLHVARWWHTATLLGNGKVLVVGGYDGTLVHSSAELYDPVANTWTLTAPMALARYAHTATLLGNGKVLVTGGDGGGGTFHTSAELYDPATDTWSLTAAPMSNPRRLHTATLLGNGTVLVAGGDFPMTLSAELYDPATDTWSPAASMSVARRLHEATLLPNGEVLVTSGESSAPASAELYDPVANTWSPAAPPSVGRSYFTATLLGNGEVLTAGGQPNGNPNPAGILATTERYSPNTWTPGGSMAAARFFHSATLLGDGTVLVAGGTNNLALFAGAELYDPVADAWSAAGAMSIGRAIHTATTLANGDVLVAGGFGGVALASAELYTQVGALSLGSPCAVGSDCVSGFCADGVCCNTACAAGACDACSVAAGAASDGTCKPLSGPVCDDGNLCTQVDICQGGACVGTSPVGCGALDQCHVAGACNPGSGVCSNPAKADGATCDDGNSSTTGETCQSGVCSGGALADGFPCAMPSDCGSGFCVDGVCASPGSTVCLVGQPCSAFVDTGSGIVSVQVPSCAVLLNTTVSLAVGPANFGLCDSAGCGTALSQVVAHTSPLVNFVCPVTMRFHWNDADADGQVDGTAPALPEGTLRVVRNGAPFTTSCSAPGCAPSNPVCVAPVSCDTAGNEYVVSTKAFSEYVLLSSASGAPVCVSIQRVGASGTVEDALIAEGSGADGSPSKNFGSSSSLTAGSVGSGQRRALLRFDLGAIPPGAVITSASAALEVLLYGGAPVRAHRITAPWSESTVTWASFADAFSPSVEATFPATGSTSASLTSLVQGWVNGSVENHGILLERDLTGVTVFASSEAIDSMRPQLDVCYLP